LLRGCCVREGGCKGFVFPLFIRCCTLYAIEHKDFVKQLDTHGLGIN